MSTYELALPAAHELNGEQRTIKALKVAKVALAAASQRAAEKLLGTANYTAEELEARNQSGETVIGMATPIVEILAHRMGEAEGIKALRAMPDGRVVAMEYQKQVITNSRGQEHVANPVRGAWNVIVTSPDDMTRRTFQLSVNQPIKDMPPPLKLTDEQNKTRNSYDFDIGQETALYNELLVYLNHLAAGFKDKSLIVHTTSELPKDQAVAELAKHRARRNLRSEHKLAHVA